MRGAAAITNRPKCRNHSGTQVFRHRRWCSTGYGADIPTATLPDYRILQNTRHGQRAGANQARPAWRPWQAFVTTSHHTIHCVRRLYPGLTMLKSGKQARHPEAIRGMRSQPADCQLSCGVSSQPRIISDRPREKSRHAKSFVILGGRQARF